MAQGTVHVKGLTELNRDLGRMNRTVQKELQSELRRLAAPVAADARSRAERFGPPTASKIKPGSSRGQAVVRQRARRTTGKRPDFGRLQMRTVLLPALAANTTAIERGVAEMFDRLADNNGF